MEQASVLLSQRLRTYWKIERLDLQGAQPEKCDSYPGERMDEGTRLFLIQERKTCIPWCALRLQKEQELRDWETLEYMTQFDPFFCSKECTQEWL